MSQSLPSRLLRVNSRFAVSGYSNSNFLSNVESSLVTNVQSVTLLSASIPRLFTNIYSPINVLQYLVDGDVYQITIPEGQYTADQLAKQIDLDPNLSCFYDDLTHRFIFGHTTVVVGTQILLATSPLANYIGLDEDIQLLPLTFFSVNSPPALGGPNQVYLESQFLAQTNCCTSLGLLDATKNIPLIIPIDCSQVPYGFHINYEAKTKLAQLTFNDLGVGSRVSLQNLDLSLTDQYGNHLNLPQNAFCDLVFKFNYTVDF